MPKRFKKLAVVKTLPVKAVEKPWTGLAMLKEFVGKIEAGELKPTKTMLFWTETDTNGRIRPHYWCQDISVPDQIAFGELIKSMAIEDWKS